MEAVAQDHNYATERLGLALAEAEELDDFLRQMKGSELLGQMGQVNLESSGGVNLLVQGVSAFRLNFGVLEGTRWFLTS